MHEYSIVQAMFDQIEAQARERHAIAVKRVYVRIGRSAGIDVPLLKTAYDWEAAAQMARAELLVGVSLLAGPRPKWKPDAPFR